MGNITQITGPATDASFGYDALDRLTSAEAADFDLSWQYDPNGNRTYRTNNLKGQSTDYTIAPDSNRLTAVDGTAYEHDANGNLTADGDHTDHYGARNRLRSVDDGATARYRYNAEGQRVYKQARIPTGVTPDLNGDGQVTEGDLHALQGYIRQGEAPDRADLNGDGRVNGQDTPCIATRIGASKNQGQGSGRKNANKGNAQGPGANRGPHACFPETVPQQRLFAFDQWRLLGEYTRNGRAVQETVWLGNLPIATVRHGEVHYVHTDHLGTPRRISESGSGEVVWEWASDPFGRAQAAQDPDGDGREFRYNLRFPGQYYDYETGRNFNFRRYYNPEIGRYITSDPLGLSDGPNTYTYAQNNPINLKDPTGEQAASGCALGSWAGPVGCGTGAAITTGVTIIAASTLLSGDAPKEQNESCGPEENDCEEIYATDTETCRAISKIRGRKAGAVCHASASERYAACLAGRPIPPLNTWNN